MGKKKPIEKYVDLSELPRLNGPAGCIDWQHSVGKHVPFCYDSIEGVIDIVGYNRQGVGGMTHLFVTIKDYAPEPIKMSSEAIINCRVSHLVTNRIANTRPDLIKYLDDPRDAFKYALNSDKSIHTHCPLCGYKKYNSVYNLSNSGFCCPVCGDGVSYPNKFIAELLSQLNIDFIREASKKDTDLFWADKYRYDFYFVLNNQKFIVEADGGFHKLEDQISNDLIKDKLAMDNNCKMIRIDCDYGTFNRFSYIKENILRSELNKLFDLRLIDWDKCNEMGTRNLIKETCFLWNDGEAIKDIIRLLRISKYTVNKYLKIGKELGLCDSYNRKEATKRGNSKPIAYFENENIIYVFKNCDELIKCSETIFGRKFKPSGIHGVCNRSRNTYYGKVFKYITKEEYGQYKMINNEVVFNKEVV